MICCTLVSIDGIAESPKENWKDAENKLYQVLYNYFDITEEVVTERSHRVEKRDKSKQRFRTSVAKLLDYKEREHILKNTEHLKDTNIYIYEDFSKETMAIRKSLWDEVKKVQQQGKYAVIKYDKIYSSEFRTRI